MIPRALKQVIITERCSMFSTSSCELLVNSKTYKALSEKDRSKFKSVRLCKWLRGYTISTPLDQAIKRNFISEYEHADKFTSKFLG